MKLEDIKHIIDEYFESVSADEIIKQFEELGYEFEDIKKEDLKDEEIEK